MVTVGIPPSSSQDGFLDFDFAEVPTLDTIIALCIANVADNSGGLTSVSVRIKNNSGLTLTGRWHVFSYTFTGGSAIVSHRGQSATTVSIANGFDGVKSLSISALEIHAGDIIAFQISKTGTTTGLVSIYTTEDVSGAKYYTLPEIPSEPVAIELATGGLMIYGTGSNYPVGGGIGGTPTDACHEVSETVEQDASSTGLWGLVTPRDFGLSGGDDAAYVDLTFPWSTVGTFAEDEIFVDGVTKSYVNDDNPLEHYTLRMNVFRYNFDIPAFTNGGFEDYSTGWSTSGSNGSYGVNTSWYVEGTRSMFIAVHEQTSNDAYEYLYQTFDLPAGTTSIKYTFRRDSLTANSQFEVLADGVVVATHSGGTVGGVYSNSSFDIIFSTAGSHTIGFRTRQIASGSGYARYSLDDVAIVSYPSLATGNVYDFRECWWVEASNGDVYVDPAAGDDDNLGFSWDEAFETLQQGLDSVGGGGIVHVRCNNTVQTLTANPSASKIIKPYLDRTIYQEFPNGDHYCYYAYQDTYDMRIFEGLVVGQAGKIDRFRVNISTAWAGSQVDLIILRKSGTTFTVVGHSGLKNASLGEINGGYYWSNWIDCNIDVLATDILAFGINATVTDYMGLGMSNEEALSMTLWYTAGGVDWQDLIDAGSFTTASLVSGGSTSTAPVIELHIVDVDYDKIYITK